MGKWLSEFTEKKYPETGNREGDSVDILHTVSTLSTLSPGGSAPREPKIIAWEACLAACDGLPINRQEIFDILDEEDIIDIQKGLIPIPYLRGIAQNRIVWRSGTKARG